VNANRKIVDLIASAPTSGDGKSGSSPDPVAHWLFSGRGCVASTISHILEQNEDIAGEISDLASQPWTLATDPGGPCHKLWAKLPTVFDKIKKTTGRGSKPGVSLPSGSPLLLTLAKAGYEHHMESKWLPGEDFSLDKRRVESRPAGRALTDIAQDLAKMTREPLLKPIDWYDPESRLQPLSQCVQSDRQSPPPSQAMVASFPYPTLGDAIGCAALNRLANAVDLAKQLASLCDVKILRLRQLEQMAYDSQEVLWDCPEANERQHAAALLQLGLLRPAASSLLSMLPFDSNPKMHDVLRTAVQKRLSRSPSAVVEVVHALEWLRNRVQPSKDENAPPQRSPQGQQSSPKKPAGRRGRKTLPAKESKRRTKILERWDRASGAGISRKEFCDDAGITIRMLQKYQDWLRMREHRKQ
jgi:hypothetical protein